MATVIDNAFKEFERVYTTLDPELIDVAKKSTENLVKNLNQFSGKGDFVDLKADLHLSFGSFARNTKIPLLDDIDLIIGLNGDGTFHSFRDPWDNKKLTVKGGRTDLCHDGTSYLNSRKVINRFVKKLSQVEHYKKADISRNQQACKLELSSYPWNFDIVPAFRTTPYGDDDRTCYIIPNGEGNWMMTDPRFDQIRIDNCVADHGQIALRIIRLVKYWQKNNAMPKMPSYLIEKIVIDFLFMTVPSSTAIPQKTFPGVLQYLAAVVTGAVQDPAGIEPDLNHLSEEERIKIAQKATEHSELAFEAWAHELSKDYQSSSKAWQNILGPSFPKHI